MPINFQFVDFQQLLFSLHIITSHKNVISIRHKPQLLYYVIMDQVKILDLIDKCVNEFLEKGYSGHTISCYKYSWNRIVQFMSGKGIEFYSPPIGDEFLTAYMKNPDSHYKMEPSVRALNDKLLYGKIRYSCRIPVAKNTLSGPVGKYMEECIVHLSNLRRSEVTLNNYRLYLGRFLSYLVNEGVTSVSGITDRHVISFLYSSTPTMHCVTCLRVMFRYWKQEGFIKLDFDEMLKSYTVSREEPVPSFYTDEEVALVEKAIPRCSSSGKRDYAMLLLASRLGLRASDISGLLLSSLDLDNDTITITMKKTGKVITLPLLADVGNAIIDYLRHARPKLEAPNVFVTLRAPYLAASPSTVCQAITQAIRRSGINTDGKRHGPHSLRHSLAGELLKNGTPIPIISESLGHRHTDTTMAYLKIDITSLLGCALPVPCVPKEFYEQKGGAFYV